MLNKKLCLTLSTVIFAISCFYGSIFCAFNGNSAVNDMLWDMPFRKSILSINDGSLGKLFYVFLLGVAACIAISVLTKAEPLSLGLWSFAVLFIIVFTTLPYKKCHFIVVALAFVAEAVYSVFAMIKNLKKIKA